MDISSMSSGSNNLINSSTASTTTSRKLSCKRKANSTEYLTCDDQPGCHKDVRMTHSQLEKRRRDKMNSFIAEMASLVPTCKTKSGKLDKLSVLRMAVQHMKTLQGSAANCCTEFHRKPAFLSDEQLKHLILRAADGFLFVVDCERGKILFVSESVHKILHYSQNELTGKSLFDYLHPKDISKIKEQLSSADTAPQETDISGLSLKADINLGSLRFSSGVRRSFFCRMKCNRNAEDKTFSSTDRRSFCTIHSTGYLKNWPSTVVDLDENNEPDNDGCNLSCLVAVGRLHPHAVLQLLQNPITIKPVEFVSRHAIDGKFVFVDQRATAVLAYLPQELLGTSLYEYLHEDDIAHLAECHRQVLQMREKINTSCYKLKIKDGSFITLRSCWFSFMNPWTKELECIVSTNTVVRQSSSSAGSYHEPAASPQTIPRILIPGEGKPDFQTVAGAPGGTRVGVGKTGGMIAESFTVISEGQRVLEETDSSMVPAVVKNLLMEQAKNLCREKE